MSAVKKIGVVVVVGAIISFAYYFLNKSKPKVSEDQLAELNADTVTSIEEQLAPIPSIEMQLQIDKCKGLSRLECEQLTAKEDIANAKATGNPLVSTYISQDGLSPRVNVFSSSRDGVTYDSSTTSTGIASTTITNGVATTPTSGTRRTTSANTRVRSVGTRG